MVRQGLIDQEAEYGSVGAKNDESWQLCIDFCKLNVLMKPNVCPLPQIDDSLYILMHSAYFSTPTLFSGYWRVSLSKD